MYYPINEQAAKTAKQLMSFSDYVPNSATNEYRAQVDEATKILERVKEQCATDAQREHAEQIYDKYCRVLAEAINRDNEIGTMCPSVMVSGGSNFPTKKKERQVAAWDKNREKFEYANDLLYKLKGAASQGIRSDDPDALTALREKLEAHEALQDKMKKVNAYYRKHKTLDGCPVLTEREIENAKATMEKDWHLSDLPYPSWALSNNNATIHRIRDRIAGLEKTMAAEEVVEESDLYRYEEDTSDMRIRFFFDGKPDEDTRNILKGEGFRWAPSVGAWQRQLTDNGRRAADRVKSKLEKLN